MVFKNSSQIKINFLAGFSVGIILPFPSKVTQIWFGTQEQSLVLTWPPNFTYVKPVDNVWDILGKKSPDPWRPHFVC